MRQDYRNPLEHRFFLAIGLDLKNAQGALFSFFDRLQISVFAMEKVSHYCHCLVALLCEERPAVDPSIPWVVTPKLMNESHDIGVFLRCHHP
jgi:hypothetical protein